MGNPDTRPQSEEFTRQDQLLHGLFKEIVRYYGINTIVKVLQEISVDPTIVQDLEFDIKLVKKGGSKVQKLGIETVATLADASEKCGIPVNEIITSKDIEAEFGIRNGTVHSYTHRGPHGPHGTPHLTPLPVGLKGKGGGRLLFSRRAVEKLVANPPWLAPKLGRPRK